MGHFLVLNFVAKYASVLFKSLFATLNFTQQTIFSAPAPTTFRRGVNSGGARVADHPTGSRLLLHSGHAMTRAATPTDHADSARR